uniref:Putative salivary deoxyribonuclease i n=1 Tax=Aedes albopictus TaxID=7160 RepID=A0A1W7R7I9_AEDAL
MAKKCGTAVFLLVIVCLNCVASFNEESTKHREKRSPRPQFPKFIFGQIAKWIPKVINKGKEVAQKVEQFIAKNPEKAAGIAAGAGVAGAVIVDQLGQKRPRPGCQVHIRRLQEKQPVFFNVGDPRSLMMPVDGNLSWVSGEKSWIACPPSDGSRNSISGLNRVSAEIECVLGIAFKYVHDDSALLITQVSCDNRVTGNVRTSPIPNLCPATYKAVGFDVPFPNIGNRFFDLYYICFNETAATTIYTRHTVYGNEIAHRCTSARPSFKVAGFPPEIDVETAYTQDAQFDRLTALFAADYNPRGSARLYYDLSYLQKGHLTPHADELFTTWQWSTYFFINVVGMWDSINNGNWKYLEESVRTLADNSKRNLNIYTGAYDTLSLCSMWEHCVDFTLSNGRVPVPKWLWKIVKSPDLDAAIALVVSNNPFIDEDPICGLGGQSHGWNASVVSNVTQGPVSYCSVQDLRNVIGNIPLDALATNLLSYVVASG